MHRNPLETDLPSNPTRHTMNSVSSRPLTHFSGHGGLPRRLVLSTLLGKPIKITQIHESALSSEGLAQHEVILIRLMEAVTNGAFVEISYTGTTLHYRPGLITGIEPGRADAGGSLRFEIPESCVRGITYFLLPVCMLAPFSKHAINIIFSGPGVITSATAAGDVSVDTFRSTIVPLLAQLGILRGIDIKVNQRSSPRFGPHVGSGEVKLECPRSVSALPTITMTMPGIVKSIRGVAYCTGLPASNNHRLIEAAREVLNPLVANVYIFSDLSRNGAQQEPRAARPSPYGTIGGGKGYGLSLVAQTTTHCVFAADVASSPAGGDSPEDLGRKCADQLLEAVMSGGCASRLTAETLLMMMMVSSQDVGRLRLSKETINSEQFLNLCRDARKLGTPAWNIKEADDDFVVQVVGSGIGNIGRKVG